MLVFSALRLPTMSFIVDNTMHLAELSDEAQIRRGAAEIASSPCFKTRSCHQPEDL
jgi:hypothetical protein